MEQMNKLMEKITKGKKLRKDQLLLLILSGILLCIIALPVKESDSDIFRMKSGLSNNNYDTVEKQKQETTETYTTAFSESAYDSTSYTLYWEAKLKEALAKIEGAGEVEVLITLKEILRQIVKKKQRGCLL